MLNVIGLTLMPQHGDNCRFTWSKKMAIRLTRVATAEQVA